MKTTKTPILTLIDDGKTVDIDSLRTSFIDRLVNAGAPPRIVQQLARHAGISTTIRFYTDVRVRDLNSAISSVAPSVEPTPDNPGATVPTDAKTPSEPKSSRVVGRAKKRGV